jgi:hypothetical protein
MADNINSKILYYRALTGICLVLTIALTWPLWSADRSFPTAPLFGVFSFFAGFQGLIFKILLIVAALLFACNIKFSEWLLCLLIAVAFADDLNRIRPDVYQYFVIAVFFACARFLNDAQLLRSFKLITGGVYLWTGLVKLNMSFIGHAFDFFSQAFHITSLPPWAHYVVILVPLLEIFIGLQLLLGKKVMPSVVIACLLHLVIIIQLYVSGWNRTFISYNLFLAAGNFILFFPLAVSDGISTAAWKGLLPKAAIVLFVALPAFSFIHLWPNFMSAGMYSFRGPYASVLIDEDLRKKLPTVARGVIYHSTNGDYLPLNYWDGAESGCVPNAQAFVYNKIFKQMQAKYNTSDSVKLFIY